MAIELYLSVYPICLSLIVMVCGVYLNENIFV